MSGTYICDLIDFKIGARKAACKTYLFGVAFYGITGSCRIPYICGAVLTAVDFAAFVGLATDGFAKEEEVYQ
ncbi:MAG: hypothetical protein K2N87_02995 [Eubacterium sp.]|nr:hypothetical protein [Eubacterium sp.]